MRFYKRNFLWTIPLTFCHIPGFTGAQAWIQGKDDVKETGWLLVIQNAHESPQECETSNYPEFTIFTHPLAMINDYRQLVMVFVLIRGVWDHSWGHSWVCHRVIHWLSHPAREGPGHLIIKNWYNARHSGCKHRKELQCDQECFDTFNAARSWRRVRYEARAGRYWNLSRARLGGQEHPPGWEANSNWSFPHVFKHELRCCKWHKCLQPSESVLPRTVGSFNRPHHFTIVPVGFWLKKTEILLDLQLGGGHWHRRPAEGNLPPGCRSWRNNTNKKEADVPLLGRLLGSLRRLLHPLQSLPVLHRRPQYLPTGNPALHLYQYLQHGYWVPRPAWDLDACRWNKQPCLFHHLHSGDAAQVGGLWLCWVCQRWLQCLWRTHRLSQVPQL